MKVCLEERIPALRSHQGKVWALQDLLGWTRQWMRSCDLTHGHDARLPEFATMGDAWHALADSPGTKAMILGERLNRNNHEREDSWT